jgi:MFS family permease
MSRRALGLIFAIMLMDVIGFSILIPIAPYIVGRYSDDALMVTMLAAIYAGAQFVAAPILGKLSDRLGRRPVLLVSVAGSAFGYFLFGIGGALWVLFLSRLSTASPPATGRPRSPTSWTSPRLKSWPETSRCLASPAGSASYSGRL